ncbi:MAG: hypothetical protein M3Z10_10630 [Gemmatimonadota bacterium]|nr:hypothetical protein [Gemmatimonadota bacterium]
MTVDSTVVPEAREVIASPLDPASLGVSGPSDPQSRAGADSMARYRALADSALAANAAFQRERISLNAAVQAMRDGDRHTRSYALSYDSLESRTLAAEHLRTARDRLRARADAARARLHGLTSVISSRRLERGTLERAAARSGRPLIHADLTRGWALLALPPGEWWIGLATRDGSLILPATALRLRGRGRDSLRLPAAAVR